jgi:hypothetical protein
MHFSVHRFPRLAALQPHARASAVLCDELNASGLVTRELRAAESTIQSLSGDGSIGVFFEPVHAKTTSSGDPIKPSQRFALGLKNLVVRLLGFIDCPRVSCCSKAVICLLDRSEKLGTVIDFQAWLLHRASLFALSGVVSFFLTLTPGSPPFVNSIPADSSAPTILFTVASRPPSSPSDDSNRAIVG